MKQTPRKIGIRNDLDHLPPPYCYRYEFDIQLQPSFSVRFSVEYYDRDDISVEEIEAEGFSENDDFEWEGSLPEIWEKRVENIVKELKKGDKKGNLKITIDKEGYFSSDLENFDSFVQELIQAVYESCGKQNKLTLELIKLPENKKLNYEISFLQLEASINDQKIDWIKSHKLLEDIFSMDFDPFNALTKEPTKKGIYLNTGDSLWYKVDSSVKSTNGKSVYNYFDNLFKEFL